MNKLGENSVGVIMDEQIPLTTLLGDEDPNIFQAVKQKIISLGPDTVIWLKPCLTSKDNTLRDHASDIIQYFGREDADIRFMAYCLQEDKDIELENGALLMAKTQYPDINAVAYSALLDDMAGEMHEWLAQSDQERNLLVRVNSYLFERLGFTGNLENYYDPENCFLNKALDRRTGNPISMCLVYALIMRRIGHSVNVIGLPGHSVCHFLSRTGSIYIDAFNLGKLLTHNDILDHLKRLKQEARHEYLAPMKPRRILARMCGNLEQIYIQKKQPEAAARIQRYLFALTR